MADLKPIGSEKLTGQDKINRIMEIARFKEVVPSSINENSKSEYSITLADGKNYQIVKERQGYIIKKTITESETDYIEPMKNRKYYSSYSQAFKRLNLMAGELNRINENEEGVSLYGEQKKFVLKTPKPEAPVADTPAPPSEPPPVPSPELPPSPVADMPAEDGGIEDFSAELDDMGPEGDVEMDAEVDTEMPSSNGDNDVVTFKSIQKLTGKLTQKIRTLENEEGMTSEDIKYVINMVLSSVDLTSLSEEDKEDILSKFESDEEMGGEEPMDMDMGDDELSSDLGDDEPIDMDAPQDDEFNEMSMNGAIFDSIFGESKVDKVISKYFEISKKEILESREKNIKKKNEKLVSVNRQMKEVVKLTESYEQELASKKFLEENSSAKIVGKTNMKNLVFENKGKQIKISPEGLLL
jgi:hypothetical protein